MGSSSERVTRFQKLKEMVRQGANPKVILKYAKRKWGSPDRNPSKWVELSDFLRDNKRDREAHSIIREIEEAAESLKEGGELASAGERFAYARRWADAEECAKELSEAGDKDGAETIFELIRWHTKGMVAEEMGNLDHAITMYFKAKEYCGLIRCYSAMEKYTELFMVLLAYGTKEQRETYGEKFLDMGLLREGVTCLSVPIEGGEKGQVGIARDYARKLLRRANPEFIKAAKIFRLTGDLDTAVEIAEKCANEERWYHSAKIKIELGNLDGAIEDAKKLMEIGETMTAATLFEELEEWKLAGEAREELGDLARASEHYSKALERAGEELDEMIIEGGKGPQKTKPDGNC